LLNKPIKTLEIMSRFKFTTTPNGKCDVTITLYTKDSIMFMQRSRTFDIKPTIKELLEEFKQYKKEGAYYCRITSTPSCCAKNYKL
jgi:hypothetical protein